MTASLSSRLRRLWLDAHLWIGVGLLIAIIPLSASGAILVWKTVWSASPMPNAMRSAAPRSG